MLFWLSLSLCLQTVEILEELVEKGSEKMDVRNKEQVVSRMKAAVASKQFGQEDILCPLIADVINLLIFSCLLVFYKLFVLIFWFHGLLLYFRHAFKCAQRTQLTLMLIMSELLSFWEEVFIIAQ